MKKVREGKIQYQKPLKDIEAELALHISKTGKEEVKRRRKAGLSIFFLKEGHIIEQKPDKSEIKVSSVKSKWIALASKDRKIVIK